MWQGIGTPLPVISSLPGVSRPGAPGGLALVDNEFSMAFSNGDQSFLKITNLRNELLNSNNKQLSFSAWIKLPALNVNWYFAGSGEGDHGPFTLGGSGSLMRTWITTSDSNTTKIISTAAAFAANRWYHVFYVIDTTQSIADDRTRFYLDGERVAINASTGTPPLDSTFNTIQNQPDVLVNAWRFDPLGTPNGTGIMEYDEFAFWNTVIDDKIIKQIYEANNTAGKTADLAQVSSSNLKAWLRMGDI